MSKYVPLLYTALLQQHKNVKIEVFKHLLEWFELSRRKK